MSSSGVTASEAERASSRNLARLRRERSRSTSGEREQSRWAQLDVDPTDAILLRVDPRQSRAALIDLTGHADASPQDEATPERSEWVDGRPGAIPVPTGIAPTYEPEPPRTERHTSE
jgi:hypothetical protein